MVRSTLSTLSIGEAPRNVKLVGELSLRLSPQMRLLHRWRMDPTGFEPASATWTECCVPITPQAQK